MDCIILKDNYDLNLLINDYKILINTTEFINRRNGPKKLGWLSIALHSCNGMDEKESNRLQYIDNKIFKPTKNLKKCNYFKKILKDLNTDIYLVRILKLTPYFIIAPHNDPEFNDRRKMIRCHIPLITNNKVYFWIGEPEQKKFNLKKGKLYYTRVEKKHWVKNESNEDRIHLVIDIKPTLKMMEIIGLNNLSIFKNYYNSNIDLNHIIKFEKIKSYENKKSKLCTIIDCWSQESNDKFLQLMKKYINIGKYRDIYIWNNYYDDKEILIENLKKIKSPIFNIYLYNSPYKLLKKSNGRLITKEIIKYLYKFNN